MTPGKQLRNLLEYQWQEGYCEAPLRLARWQLAPSGLELELAPPADGDEFEAEPL